MDDIKPWYLSRTVWGSIVAIAASAAGLLGVPLDPAEQEKISDAILQAIGAGGAVMALIGRFAATSRIF